MKKRSYTVYRIAEQNETDEMRVREAVCVFLRQLRTPGIVE